MEDGTAEPVSRDQTSGANGDTNIFIFSVQLSTSRTGNNNVPVVDAQSAICDNHTYYTYNRRYFQHAHFILIVGVGKRSEY